MLFIYIIKLLKTNLGRLSLTRHAYGREVKDCNRRTLLLRGLRTPSIKILKAGTLSALALCTLVFMHGRFGNFRMVHSSVAPVPQYKRSKNC